MNAFKGKPADGGGIGPASCIVAVQLETIAKPLILLMYENANLARARHGAAA